MIGLGDRHCDNILLDKSTGEVVHVNLDCIFHEGKCRKIPEIVDFRLTRNIESPMGAFKCYALYQYYFKIACEIFKKNIGALLSALDSFATEPDFKYSLRTMKERVEVSQERIDQIMRNNKASKFLEEMPVDWMPHM